MNALILVDIQNDFCPGGALAIPNGDEVVAPANHLMDAFDIIIATQDWHPADHGGFAENHPGHKPGDVIDLDGIPQILRPAHCVQDTPGAAFHPALHTRRFTKVIRMGEDPRVDRSSAFFDNGRRNATELNTFLKMRDVEEVFVCGLTTDSCVKFTALDALELGYRVTVIEDICRGVNLEPGDAERAIEEMRRAGARITTSDNLGV